MAAPVRKVKENNTTVRLPDGTTYNRATNAAAVTAAIATTATVDATLNTGGTTAERPVAPVTYQSFFDTTLGKPVWYDGAGWVDATGTTA